MFLPLAIALTLAALIFVVLLAVDQLVDSSARTRLLRGYQVGTPKGQSPWGRRYQSVLQAVRPAAFLDAWVSQRDLHWAGIAMTVDDFLSLWWLSLLFGGSSALLIMITRNWDRVGLAFGILIILGSASIPYLFLKWRIAQRTREIRRTLPDFLDLLTFTVEAGLGFLPALQRVCQHYPGVLGGELRQMLLQIEMGFTREEALDAFAERSPSQDIPSFVEAVKLSEQLGTSLARTLRVQANLLRQRRRQRAQAAAQTAPIRIIPALVFFFLPSLLLIYLAPPLINFFMRR